MKRWNRRAAALGVICSSVFLFYVGSFFWRFDVFGDAVRDDKHGWLGPAIRGDSHTVDIGKVLFYEGTDFSLYRTYRPCCRLWLSVMGFSD